MKVRALKPFFDREGKCLRYPGSEFDASEERVAVLNGTEAGQLVETLPEDDQAAGTAQQTEPKPEPEKEPESKPEPEQEPEDKPKAAKAKK